eukprot:Nk52_evm25s295 gene=Nk52_evmTU25s295
MPSTIQTSRFNRDFPVYTVNIEYPSELDSEEVASAVIENARSETSYDRDYYTSSGGGSGIVTEAEEEEEEEEEEDEGEEEEEEEGGEEDLVEEEVRVFAERSVERAFGRSFIRLLGSTRSNNDQSIPRATSLVLGNSNRGRNGQESTADVTGNPSPSSSSFGVQTLQSDDVLIPRTHTSAVSTNTVGYSPEGECVEYDANNGDDSGSDQHSQHNHDQRCMYMTTAGPLNGELPLYFPVVSIRGIHQEGGGEHVPLQNYSGYWNRKRRRCDDDELAGR